MKHTNTHRHLLVLGIVVAAIALAMPVNAAAQRRGGARGFGGGEGQMLWTLLDQRYEDFTKDLSLTEAQTGLVTVVVEDFRETNADALKRLAAMRAEMQSLMGGGGRPDRQAMAGILAKHGNPGQALAPAFETLKTNVTDVLDPEQVEKLTGLLARRRRPGG